MYCLGTQFPEAYMLSAVDSTNEVTNIDVTELDGWKVVYFYPKDFTFVCPTEIVDFDNHVDSFKKLNTTVIGISPDNEYVKLAWKQSNPMLSNLKHTLAADSGNRLAEELGIVSDGNVPYRATFILNADNIIKYVGITDLNVGRSAAEVLRVLDSTQKGDDGLLCAANRVVGGETL